MTRVFSEDGSSTAVSVIYVAQNRVTALKTNVDHGYTAVQVTTGVMKRSRINKPATGEFAKAGVDAGRGLWEFRVSEEDLLNIKVGDEYGVDAIEKGAYVDVQGLTIGKGFAGVVKRHHFRMQDATHGNSLSHRAPGSIGQNQTPGRVFKGKKMAGHLGNVRRTIQNLKVIEVSKDHSVLLVSGAVPGSVGGCLIVNPAVKK
jgi:large subunit ribosomal protein L3